MVDPSTVDHDRNVIGAAAVLVADRLREAVEQVTAARGTSAPALTALLAWADGAPIHSLAEGLGLSHSRAVRVVDQMERDRLVRRRPDPLDARRILVTLTGSGRRAARRVLAARADALDAVLGQLSAEHVKALARVAEELLFAESLDRATARRICRLCDAVGCGHLDGRCPSTAGADAREDVP